MPAPGVTVVRGPVRQRYGSKVPDPRPHPPGPGPGLWARMIMSGMRGRSPALRRGCLTCAVLGGGTAGGAALDHGDRDQERAGPDGGHDAAPRGRLGLGEVGRQAKADAERPASCGFSASGPLLLCPVACHLVALRAGVLRCPRTHSGRESGPGSGVSSRSLARICPQCASVRGVPARVRCWLAPAATHADPGRGRELPEVLRSSAWLTGRAADR